MRACATAVVVVALAAVALAIGCGTASDAGAPGPLTVYVSAPLRGPDAVYGKDIRDGAQLALEQAEGQAGEVEIEAEFLDDTAGSPETARWSAPVVAENARAASQDTAAIAYIGDFDSGATRISLPITNQAMLPQVSPASTALDLVSDPGEEGEPPAERQPGGERTFVRVIPDDRVQAESAAAWARSLRVRRAATLSDGSAFGDGVVEEFAEAASDLGMEVVEAEGADELPPGTQLVFAGGAAAPAVTGLRAAAEALPDAVLMSTDALLLDSSALRDAVAFEPRLRLTASAQSPRQLPPRGQEFAAAFEDEYGRPPGPYAAYAYEAMALVLDAIERAGAQTEDRRAVLDALYATSDRASVLGSYSITAVGNTTLEALAGYRIEHGRPRFERPLVPR